MSRNVQRRVFVFVHLLLGVHRLFESNRYLPSAGTCIKFCWINKEKNETYEKFPLTKEPISGLERPVNTLNIIKEVYY